MNFPQFRTLSLALPEVVEAPHFEKVSFRVKNKIFATYDIAKNQATLKLTLLDHCLYCMIYHSVISTLYIINGEMQAGL